MVYVYIAAAALVLAAVIMFILMLAGKKKRVKSSQVYYEALSRLYGEKSVVDSLIIIREEFKKKSTEYIAVDKAVFYLTNSIARDYKTAFMILEKVFNTVDVRTLHLKIMEKEKQNVMLLLQ